MPESLIGKTLDRYAILEMIGEGGMGAVYLGEHTQIQRRVAVKVLHPHLAASQPDLAQRMLNEAKAAAMIGHPGIVDVVDYGVTPEGIHFLVMELLNGQELRTLLDTERTLSQAVALPIIDHVLSALGAAHEIGIVHRDLKPDNVFLHVARTGLYEVKLLDFGISKFTANREMRLTATGAVMGTPYYMSLEQAEGRTDVDLRTDIYATSVILYQALSGVRPFDGENVNQVLVAILRGEFTPLGELCPGLSPDLVEIVHRGMARERDQRYATASALQEALRPHWDPEDQSIVEVFQTLPGVDAQPRLGVIGASGRFQPAPASPTNPQALSHPGSPPAAAQPGVQPAAAAPGVQPAAAAPGTPIATAPGLHAPPADRVSQTVDLRAAAPSGSYPQAVAPAGTQAGQPPRGPGMTAGGPVQAPQAQGPGMSTGGPVQPPWPHGPGGGAGFSLGQWLHSVSRERWIQIIKISTLVFVVATTTALISTRGCENCDDADKQAAAKAKKRKKKKKTPKAIRRWQRMFRATDL